jgi:hypothetical protein
MVVFRASRPFRPGHGGHCCCRVTFRLPCFTQIIKELSSFHIYHNFVGKYGVEPLCMTDYKTN